MPASNWLLSWTSNPDSHYSIVIPSFFLYSPKQATRLHTLVEVQDKHGRTCGGGVEDTFIPAVGGSHHGGWVSKRPLATVDTEAIAGRNDEHENDGGGVVGAGCPSGVSG